MLVLYDIDPFQRPMVFPPLKYAWGEDTSAPGLLARGGDLSSERLKLAYAQGIFPWFNEGEPILWWSLDPRMVLYPHQFKFSRSLSKTLRRFLQQEGGEIRVNTNFTQTMVNCSAIEREGQDGTWIVPKIIGAYTKLHLEGVAHSFEAWKDGVMIGGLYGVNLGGMFYGESMFSKQRDASKFALCGLIAYARTFNIQLIDCQQETPHLKSLGGSAIPRVQFAREMMQAQQAQSPQWEVGAVPKAYWKTLGFELA